MTEQKKSKARQALAEAFRELVVTRDYNDFHVADIISQADVSRSTFYEHYRNKDDILRESLAVVIDALSGVGFDDGTDRETLAFWMNHFRDVKEVAVVFFKSDVSEIVVKMLAESITDRLDQRGRTGSVPNKLLALQVAHSTIGFIRAWLTQFNEIAGETATDQLLTSTRLLINTQD